MPSWVKNRITLHGADQEEIDKVIDFLRSEDREVDFNNIIPMPEEIKETMEEGRMIDYTWAYYQAKEFGDYTEIDKCLRSSLWVESEGIKTRNELLDYFLKQKTDIYEYGKRLYNLEKKYGCHNANRELKDYKPIRGIYMTGRKTSFEERREIVEYCIGHNKDYKGTAAKFDVSYYQVYS